MDQPNLDEDSSLKMPQDEPDSVQIDYSTLNQPEPMGSRPTGPRPPTGQATRSTPSMSAPTSMPAPSAPTASKGDFTPSRPIVPFLLMFFLAIILVAAVLVFFSWKGWIKVGQNFWHKSSPSPTGTPTVSPSPEASPKTVTNVNDQIRKSDLENIQQALKRYWVDKGKYPVTLAAVKTSDTESVLAKALIPDYLEKLPDDPLAPKYYYAYKSDGDTFELTCILEDTSDPAGAKVGDYYLYKITNIK